MNRRTLLAGLALLSIAGCAVAPDRPPEISLVDVRPTQAGLFEQKVHLVLAIANPNDTALVIDGYRFDLELNGKPFARGMSPERVSVDRLSDATTEASATVSTMDLMRQVLAAPAAGGFRYRLTGTAFVADGGGRRQVPFEQSGELDFLSLR